MLLQVYVQDIEKNPDNWSTPRLTELMEMQAMELDRGKRIDQFTEMVEILRQGEGHWVPNTWVDQGAALDYRLQHFNTPDFHPAHAQLGVRVVGPGRRLPRR